MIAVPKRLKGVHRDRTFAGFLLCVNVGAGLDALIAIILLYFHFILLDHRFMFIIEDPTLYTQKKKNKSLPVTT